MMFLFILSVPFMIKHTEKQAFNKGMLYGANSEREIIDTDIANGATANRTCTEIQSPFYPNSSYVECKVTWNYPPNPRNATEQRERYGL